MLHSGGECSSSWVRNSCIEHLSNTYGFMTASIDAMESFYSDMVNGRKYFTYLTNEVMRLVQIRFNSSEKREDNFVIGFSMGAHGAIKAALRWPEKFSACYAMSGAKDQVKMGQLAMELGITANDKTMTDVFGLIEEIYGSENDLLSLSRHLKESGQLSPMLYMSCGTEDYGYQLCREYKNYLDEVGLSNEFYSVPGSHDYVYANAVLEKAIKEILPI